MTIRTGSIFTESLAVGDKNRVAATSVEAMSISDKARVGASRVEVLREGSAARVGNSVVELLILEALAPNPPLNLSVYSLTGDSASFIWTEPAPEGTEYLSYEYSLDGAAPINVGLLTEVDISGLTSGTTHTFRVRSVGEAGVSTWTSIEFTTLAIPNPPTGLTITNVTANGGTASWTAPSSGPAVTGYEYSVSDSEPIVLGISTQVVFTNATPNTTHTFKLRSMGGSGKSAWVEVSFTTKGAPNAPTSLTSSNVGATTARLTWSTPSGGTPPTGHRYSIDFGPSVEVGLVNQLDISGLSPNEEHLIRVQAFNSYGDSPWSSVSLITTMDGPSTPEGLEATTVTASSATLNWYPVQTGFPVDTYEMQLDDNPVVDLLSTNPSATIENLLPGTTHTFKVRGRNGYGVSPWASVEFQTILGAPNPPVNLQTTKIEQTGAIVTWGPALTGPASLSYEYSLNLGEVMSAGTIRRLVFENMAAGSKLNLRVRAVGAYATSEWAELDIQLSPADIIPDFTLRLQWDQLDKRYYEEGLDRGVLYLSHNVGVAWNGLTAIDESLSSESTEPLYVDGVKYLDDMIMGDFEATLRAITYPDEFAEYEGFVEIGEGILADDQTTKLFGLCYRTQVGDATGDEPSHYKLHLVYNLTAVPDGKTHTTRGSDTAPTEFGWTISGVPLKVPGYRPTAHVILDSRYINKYILRGIEDILYGDDVLPARLPDITEVDDFIENYQFLVIIDNGDGTWTARGPEEMIQMVDPTTFRITEANATYSNEFTYTIRNS